MKVSELKLESSIIDFLKSEGYEELFEPQERSVKAGLFDGKKNFLITIPTASGKTLIAMLAILSHLSKYKTKVVYLTPLRALASEKFEEFKKLEKLSLGRKIKVAISTGQEKTKTRLQDADIIFLTNESMDAHMAFQSSWINDVELVISDEIHLIGDHDRGPTLEMILTRFRPQFKRKKQEDLKKTPFQMSPKIIGLSATVSNSIQLANWLDCKLIESDFRRVPLSETVYASHNLYDKDGSYDRVNFVEKDGTVYDRHKKAWIGLGLETVEKKAQCLIFSQSRRNAVVWAKDAAIEIKKLLSENELKILAKISDDIVPKEKEDQTNLVNDLAKVVKHGSAFHHAGLDQRSRHIIEAEFKKGNIKLLTATPTLAAGVNLPARRVIIQTTKRFSKYGMQDISVLEYKQMCGRAGRPQYDKMGESVIISSFSEYEEDLDEYVRGEVEPLESKTLKNSSTLRINLLGFIKNISRKKGTKQTSVSFEKILDFFSKTFGSYQEQHDMLAKEKFDDEYRDLEGYLDLEDSDKKIINKLYDDTKPPKKLIKQIEDELENLKKYNVIEQNKDGYRPTSFGIRVFFLRIDPKTADLMHDKAEKSIHGREHISGILHMITSDLSELPQIKLGEKFEGELTGYNHAEKLYKEQDLEKNLFRSLFILLHWIDNLSYSKMSEKYNIEPGDIFNITRQAENLMYNFQQIIDFWREYASEHDDVTSVSKYDTLIDELDILKRRIQHGVPKKYLELVKIKQIGRVRAQILYKNGYDNRTKLKKVQLEKLAAIDKIGMTLAKSIKSQVEKVR